MGVSTYVFCGNYRTFEVDAETKDEARRIFAQVKPRGLSEKDITGIKLKHLIRPAK